MLRAISVLASVPLILSGCLSSSYDVPPDALARLAVTDPATRSKRVRVVQRFVTSEDPPSAPSVAVHTHVLIVGSPSRGARSRRGGGGGSGGSGGGGGGGNVGSADADAESAAVLIFIAGAAALGLAATEGARYDGWAELHPMHPLHLRLPGQGWTWVPLSELTPELAFAADEAIVDRDEGPWTALGRAPLNRVGLTYALELGGAGLDSVVADRPWGFMGRIQLGGYPIQEIGILGSVGLGWGENTAGETIFNSRYAFELHVYPLTLGLLSLGTYGQLGYAFSREDTDLGITQSRWNLLYGGGALAQLELTTRLALTLRGGVTALDAPGGVLALPEASLGLAIY